MTHLTQSDGSDSAVGGRVCHPPRWTGIHLELQGRYCLAGAGSSPEGRFIYEELWSATRSFWRASRFSRRGFIVLASAAVGSPGLRRDHVERSRWMASWAAAPQAPSNDAFALIGEPTNPGVSGFNNQTVRNIVFTSVGGSQIRVHLSNAYGTRPVTIAQTTVGDELAGAQLVPGSVRSLTFGGRSSVTASGCCGLTRSRRW